MGPGGSERLVLREYDLGEGRLGGAICEVALSARNVILSSLGKEDFEDEPIGVGVMSLRPGDRFLISSDGVHDVLTSDQLAELVGEDQSPEVIAARIIDRAVEAGAGDDVSAVVLSVTRHESAGHGALANAARRVRGFFSADDELVANET